MTNPSKHVPVEANLFILEADLRKAGYATIAGVDEAGRGALAGPVVAGAVILDPRRIPDGIDDSKKLSERVRERLSNEVRASASTFCVAALGPGAIDSVNILQATLRAMRSAVSGLDIMPDLVLVDGNQRMNFDPAVEERTIIRGDSLSISIAAASILAKTFRDQIMRTAGILFPEYGFARHKGYATELHRDAIFRHGPCAIHRSTFIERIVEQRTLFDFTDE